MPEMHSRSQLARAWRQTGMLLLAAAILLAAAPSWAADEAALEMNWGGMAMTLLGLALFLFGMEQMSAALKARRRRPHEGRARAADHQPFHGGADRRLRDRRDPVVVGDDGAGRRVHHGRPDDPVAVDRRHHGRQHRHHVTAQIIAFKVDRGRAAAGGRRLRHAVLLARRAPHTAAWSWGSVWSSSA